MEDNVVQMPSKTDRLMNDLAADYKLMQTGEADWKAGAYNFCLHIVQVRDQFPSNNAFNKALDNGNIKVSHQDRSAAINMGRDPIRLKEVLNKTDSRSLRMIYDNEFRLTSSGKTIDPSIARINMTPQTKKALDAIDKVKARGARLTQKTVAREAGVSETAVRRAFHIRQTQAAAEPKPVSATREDLSPTAQQKFDAALKRATLEVEANIHAEATAAIEKWWVEVCAAGLQKLQERITKFETIQKLEHPFTTKQYGKLLKVVHPDNIASKELRDEVFVLVKEREVRLRPDVETELRQQADALRGRILVLHQEKLTAWRAANPGHPYKKAVPEDVSVKAFREATREAKAEAKLN